MGQISEEVWKALFAYLRGIPAVIETPYGSSEADAEEIRLVKELAGRLPISSRGV